jgi:hypothetical protein
MTSAEPRNLLRIGPMVRCEAKFRVGRSLFTEQVSRSNVHALDQRLERRPIRGSLEVFDHRGLNACIPDQRQYVT